MPTTKTFPQIVSLPIIRESRCTDVPRRSVEVADISLEPLSRSPYSQRSSFTEANVQNEQSTDKWTPISISSSDEANDNVNHQLKGK